MSEVNDAPLLVVAGIKNEDSLGWSAARTWLDLDPNNQLLASVRSPEAVEFIQAKEEALDGRVTSVTINWGVKKAERQIRAALKRFVGTERRVSGVVHSMAHADGSSFGKPAHEVDGRIYTDAFRDTAASLDLLVRGTKKHVRPNGGYVTFGFGKPGEVIKEYGGPMSVAKVALSHLVEHLALSLGHEDPPARIAEVVTGYVPSYAGRGVALAQRLRPKAIERHFTDTSALGAARSAAQQIKAGQVAIDFIINPMWSQTTGQRFNVDAGWSIVGKGIVPSQ